MTRISETRCFRSKSSVVRVAASTLKRSGALPVNLDARVTRCSLVCVGQGP